MIDSLLQTNRYAIGCPTLIMRNKNRQSRTYGPGGYGNRDSALLELGFADYRSYLTSDLWKSIRRRVMMRDRFSCRLCNAAAVVVHHHDYTKETLGGSSIENLYALCNQCHERLEKNRYGNKTCFCHVKQKLLKALKKVKNRATRERKRKRLELLNRSPSIADW